MEPLLPSCSLGMSDSFLVSCLFGLRKIHSSEEEEEGNKMGFGQRWLIPSFLLSLVLVQWLNCCFRVFCRVSVSWDW